MTSRLLGARRALRRWAAACGACALAAAVPFAAANDTQEPITSLQQRLDRLVHEGFDRPDAALQAVKAMRDHLHSASALRSATLARGLIEAEDGRVAAAQASAQMLAPSDSAGPDPLAVADSELVLATLQETNGRLDLAAEHAQAALLDYERLCGRSAVPARADCDYRARWRVLQLLGRRAWAQGIQVTERNDWQAAAELAHEAEDPLREAWSLSLLAVTYAQTKEFDAANRLLLQARRVADAASETRPEAIARVKLHEGLVADLHGDATAARRANEEGLRLAREANSPRLASVFVTNLSDHRLKQGRPQEALALIEQALPVAREHHDRGRERVLLHNAALARIGLHQLAEAKRDFEQMLALWGESGAEAQANALREFGDALADAGDHVDALAMYHRERQLAADIMARNHEATLRDLQTRYEREAKQRHIALLERDNALKSAQIHSRALLQKVWSLLALTLGVGLVAAVLLYRRVRETQRQLERSHARLRVQSERDVLTGLANRRYFQDVMRERGAHEAFEGALLLVDIDHFKRVNDTRGHAAGDEVLVDMAQRLSDAVRDDDLVVRWGGEEFLIYAPGVPADQLDGFAARLLHAINDRPFAIDAGPLAVTASLGYAHFPLPPARWPQSWEHAVNFVDMALYTAKSLGRHRAVGIVTVHADTPEGLHQVEADFERAWTEGVVALNVIDGHAGEAGVAA